MKQVPDGLRKDKKRLHEVPAKAKNGEWSTNGHSNSSTETDWKAYHRNPQLDHAAGDYEPLQHREKLHMSEHPKEKMKNSKKMSSPLLRDLSTLPTSREQMDDTIHLLMQEELYAEGFDQP
jgi:hypothetical protein